MDTEAITWEKLNRMDRKELIGQTLELAEALRSARHNEELYREQIMALKKGVFGRKTEVLSPVMQPSLFDEIEDSCDESADEEALVQVISTRKKHKKRARKEMDLESLIAETVHVDMDKKTCPDCGGRLKELAPEKKYVLSYVPSHYKVTKYVIHKYVCPACTEREEKMKEIASPGGPVRLIEGSVIDGSVVAGIAVNKFMMGLPLYRQEKELKQRGIPISRQSMSNWLMKSSDLYLEAIFKRMHKDLAGVEVIHMDETQLTCLEERKNGKRSKS